jgi:hypothetical protein
MLARYVGPRTAASSGTLLVSGEYMAGLGQFNARFAMKCDNRAVVTDMSRMHGQPQHLIPDSLPRKSFFDILRECVGTIRGE